MIAISELALASIGIATIIADDMPKIGVARRDSIEAVERKIPQLAKKLVHGELDYESMLRPHSYRKLLDVLGNLPRSVDVRSWIERFKIEDQADIGAPFAIAAQTALNDLAAVFPRQSYETLTGPQDLEPPSTQVWQFFSVLDVVNDPLRVFPLIACGGISKRQTEAVRMIFPGISLAIDDAITEATIDAKAAKKSFRLSQIVTYGISTWQGKRIVTYLPPQVQQQTAPAAQRPADRPAQAGAAKDSLALAKSTKTQTIEQG